jgi:hypothetical protein
MATKKRSKKRRRPSELERLRRRVLDLEADAELHFNWILDLRKHAKDLEEVLQGLIDALLGRTPKGKRRGTDRT